MSSTKCWLHSPGDTTEIKPPSGYGIEGVEDPARWARLASTSSGILVVGVVADKDMLASDLRNEAQEKANELDVVKKRDRQRVALVYLYADDELFLKGGQKVSMFPDSDSAVHLYLAPEIAPDNVEWARAVLNAALLSLSMASNRQSLMKDFTVARRALGTRPVHDLASSVVSKLTPPLETKSLAVKNILLQFDHSLDWPALVSLEGYNFYSTATTGEVYHAFVHIVQMNSNISSLEKLHEHVHKVRRIQAGQRNPIKVMMTLVPYQLSSRTKQLGCQLAALDPSVVVVHQDSNDTLRSDFIGPCIMEGLEAFNKYPFFFMHLDGAPVTLNAAMQTLAISAAESKITPEEMDRV